MYDIALLWAVGNVTECSKKLPSISGRQHNTRHLEPPLFINLELAMPSPLF